MSPPLVAIFGSSAPPLDEIERARRLGRELAEAGFGVLNGGYGGTMEASAAGAREAGGHTVGVTCRTFTFRSGANPHIREVVEAESLTARIETLLTRASAYVALPGGNGTLAELSLAWEHVRRHLLPGPPRPIVAWEEPWRRVLGGLAEGSRLESGTDGIVWVRSVDEAVAEIRRRLG